jgi:hypothetical protein
LKSDLGCPHKCCVYSRALKRGVFTAKAAKDVPDLLRMTMGTVMFHVKQARLKGYRLALLGCFGSPGEATFDRSMHLVDMRGGPRGCTKSGTAFHVAAMRRGRRDHIKKRFVGQVMAWHKCGRHGGPHLRGS